MASQDLIFPLLPRNTTVAVSSDLDKVTQLQKKPKIKGVAGDDAGDETQQARVEERQKQRQQERRQQEQSEAKGEASKQASADAEPRERPFDPDSSKGQNLDTFA
ncbi:hypothetical protein [Aliidiomarina quisquiliarum]|uniref:hypothetical protein n=1 Tax=Aliidiomarina quisquiliarum TaxID=2938947 RepID=UPI00208E5664|nr:hypothetical protein [Aliidiomarina quisquiliarum]MCO4320188.1 hypothetical protein [Aliidiomarina quisquiliarum]